jgi:argininosuccinate synthase
VVGRKAPDQLYRLELATYGHGDQFDQSAAAGFIKLWGMSVRTAAEVQGQLPGRDLGRLLGGGEVKRLTP